MRLGIVSGSSKIMLAVTGPLAQRNPGVSHKHEPSGGSLFVRQRWLSALLTGPVNQRLVGQDVSREVIHQQCLMANPPHVDLQLGVGDLYGEGSTPNHARAPEGDMDLNTRCITRYSKVISYKQESQRALSINRSRSSLDIKEIRRKTECRAREMKEQAFVRRLETLEAGRDWRGVLAAMVSFNGRVRYHLAIRSTTGAVLEFYTSTLYQVRVLNARRVLYRNNMLKHLDKINLSARKRTEMLRDKKKRLNFLFVVSSNVAVGPSSLCLFGSIS